MKLLADAFAVTSTATTAGKHKSCVAELELEAGVEPGYIRRCLLPKAQDTSRGENSLAFQVDKRGPVIFTEDVDAFMVDQALQWEGDFSWQEMAAAVNEAYGLPEGVPDGTGVRKHCLKSGWTDTRQRILPWLTDAQITKRQEWAQQYTRQDWMAWVDVDEKWFYTVKLHGRIRIVRLYDNT